MVLGIPSYQKKNPTKKQRTSSSDQSFLSESFSDELKQIQEGLIEIKESMLKKSDVQDIVKTIIGEIKGERKKEILSEVTAELKESITEQVKDQFE